MRKKTRIPLLGSGKPVLAVLAIAVLFVSLSAALLQPARQATAAANSYINFQARLMNGQGAIVPDGYYNVEFKIFNASTSSGSSQGSCTGDANCLCHSQEQRPGQAKVRRYMQLFPQLTLNRCVGMLAGFDVTATWQPQARLFMIHEQKLIGHWVKEREVGDQVLGWQRRLGNAAERRAGIDPGECCSHLGLLKWIIGLNCPHKLRNDRAHRSIPFPNAALLWISIAEADARRKPCENTTDECRPMRNSHRLRELTVLCDARATRRVPARYDF